MELHEYTVEQRRIQFMTDKPVCKYCGLFRAMKGKEFCHRLRCKFQHLAELAYWETHA